ncbi:hypothetical protein BDM02DRAFT_3264353, partial [Thelephora ganbajun]
MWDDRRKVGILNDFDLARFADQTDLLSEEGLRGEIPRRYRHEAESFAWSLICLCLATVVNKHGEDFSMHPHPLRRWFEDWRTSRDAKLALHWCDHDHSDTQLSHPN